MSEGYFDSPWPAEDGGPARLQQRRSGSGLHLKPGQRLRCTTRNTVLSTMTVLGAAGEVFLLTHSALRARLGLPTTACVERIDPVTLKTLSRSPRLAGGPMWPGGMAVHRNGRLVVVYGRHAHLLERDCTVLATRQLPVDQPYNSFVILDNGLVVTKNLSESTPARLTVLDAHTLHPACEDTLCPEPSVARLSAVGNTVYLLGVRSVFRYHWNDAAARLERDVSWQWNYAASGQQSFGWDMVLDGHNAWFMDNGRHRYLYTMRKAGVSATPNRLLRVSMRDASDSAAQEVCGLLRGSITNPPLVDPARHIVVAFDSANAWLGAWRHDPLTGNLAPLWRKHPFGCASHMVLNPASGQLLVNDYRRFGEEVVMLDIETGAELGRVRSGGIMQGVVFPAAGWNQDVYWCSMSRVARIFIDQD